MKRLLPLLLLLTLTGCAPSEPAPAPAVEVLAPAETQPQTLSLGLSVTAHIQKSMHATESFPGRVQLEVTAAAVLVDEGGIIRSCTIDGVRAVVPFDQSGTPLLYAHTVFPSKCALGDDYGMARASSIGQEWHEQAAELAAACIGKTAAQLQSGDVTSSATINTDDALQAVIEAAESAVPCAASLHDPLTLTCAALLTKATTPNGGQNGCIALRCAALAAAADCQRTCALTAHVPVTAAGQVACPLHVGLSPLSDILRPATFTQDDSRLLAQN